jgi:translation initiation factor IF-3
VIRHGRIIFVIEIIYQNHGTPVVKIRLSNEPDSSLAKKAEFAGRRLQKHGRIMVQVLLRGQEPQHPEAATALLDRFVDMIDRSSSVESISLPRRNLMEMVLVLVD